MERKEIEVMTTKQVYVAFDGTEFETEKECVEYENKHNESRVNQMLWDALLTDSRKRKCEHQSELEELGYIVFKDGGWTIKKGDAFIWKKYDDKYINTWKGYSVYYGRYYKGVHRTKNKWVNGRDVNVPKEKINLAGILNAKPTYVEPRYGFLFEEPSSKNVYKMKLLLRTKKNAEFALQNADAKRKKAIEDAYSEYERKVEIENKYYDRTIKSSSSDLEKANNGINELLKR